MFFAVTTENVDQINLASSWVWNSWPLCVKYMGLSEGSRWALYQGNIWKWKRYEIQIMLSNENLTHMGS